MKQLCIGAKVTTDLVGEFAQPVGKQPRKVSPWLAEYLATVCPTVEIVRVNEHSVQPAGKTLLVHRRGK
jgi:hypothetical protein